MAINILVSGIARTGRYISTKKAGVQSGITEGMAQGALALQDEVEESIAGRRAEPMSVDTGELVQSIDFSLSRNSATVFSDSEHAQFMEYGTSTITARRHFRNSMNRMRLVIQKIIADDIKRKT